MGCTNTYRYEASDGYRESYNVVAKRFGEIYITSGLSSSVIEKLPENFGEEKYFVAEGDLIKPWASISIYKYISDTQCFDEERNLSLIINEMLSENILPPSNFRIRMYFVPEKQFEITTKSQENNEFSFYFPVNLCDLRPALTALDNASARLIHELYHLKIELGARARSFDKQKEEENAYILEFCNRVTSPSKSVLSHGYFDIDYGKERERMIDFSQNRMQRNSHLGRLDAMKRIHHVLSGSESIYDYCTLSIKNIGYMLFAP